MRRAQVAILLLFTLVALPARARNWRISDFHSSVAIDHDGNMVTIERISLVFVGEFHGIYRSIPVDYPGPQGTNYRLFLDITSVTDDQGRALKYESKREGPYRKLKIYVPGAVDTTKTVLITYASPNAVRFFDDHDEFYWNVTGNDWPVPIDHASAIVSFPPGVSGGLRAQAFTGVYGSHDREATSQIEGSRVSFETTNPLPMRGGLTIDIYIPKGILHQPGPITRAWWLLKANPVLLVPFWTFAVMFLLWYYKGRDPAPGLSVAPMYEPPKGMTPAETGALIDDGVQPRDVTCTLVDLAVRGYVKIKEVQEKVLLFTHKDYEFTLLKPMAQWGSDLAPHERDAGKRLPGGRGHTPVIAEEPLLHSDSGDPGGHHVGAEDERHVPGGPGCGARVDSVWAGGDRGADRDHAISEPGVVAELAAAGGHFYWNLTGDRVALRPADGGQDGAGRPDPGAGPGLPGIHEPGGRGPVEAHAAGHLREISAVRYGSGRGASLGAGVRRNRPEPAELVRGSRRLSRRLQSRVLYQQHARHEHRHAPGLHLGTPRFEHRLGMVGRRGRGWWRILRRRLRRGRRRGVLRDRMLSVTSRRLSLFSLMVTLRRLAGPARGLGHILLPPVLPFPVYQMCASILFSGLCLSRLP